MFFSSFLNKIYCFLFLTLLCFSFPVRQAISQEPFIKNGGYLVVSASGETLASYKETANFTPASIFKIVTAFQALEILGPDYRFPTYFFVTPRNDLYIMGTGDPLLISEDIDPIIAALKKRGITGIRNICIDPSRYKLKQKTINSTISTNPYDTPLSALGVNFNTIKIKITENGDVISGEPQTPTLPIMKDKGQGLEKGMHRINLGTENHDLVLYAGQLFKAGLIRADIPITGEITAGKMPKKARLVHTHYSPELQKILPSMLLYSNNFMANQIYLKSGVKRYGYPATWPKAKQAMRSFLQENNLITPPIRIVDGAGLSRKNSINCQTMMAVLQRFRKYSYLLPIKKNIPLKSGTMTGVYAYAGYFDQSQDAPAFVLILNQNINNRDALLDQLIKQIHQPLSYEEKRSFTDQ